MDTAPHHGTWLTRWIEKNSWAMLLALGTVGGIWMTDRAATEARINQLEADNKRLEAKITRMEGSLSDKLGGRHDFMNDAAAIVNYVCQDNEGCRNRFAPIRVPE